ncbi:MAG: SUF system NifU family Fe-S cluster assembly protein [Kiloniellales bacterium]
MFDELRELYQEVILDHGTKPRNHHELEAPTCRAHGLNPICGDALTVYLMVDDGGVIQDASFEGRGCAISMASASMMTEVIKGRTVADAQRLFGSFHSLCTEDDYVLEAADAADADDLERLNVLSGVREFPVRVKCATLPWHTMNAAMSGEDEISTE